jgi:diacylglycerol kinase family enzyme
MSAEHAFPTGGFPEATPFAPDAPTPSDHVSSLTSYDQLVVFRNPKSSHANSGLEPLQALEAAGLAHKLEVIERETSPYRRANINALHEAVTADSLIVVRAGDGGLSGMLSAVRAAGLENSVLALPGGNKNDIATSLRTGQLLKNPDNTLLHARPHYVRPILIRYGYEDEELTTLDAYGYASVGISSQVALQMNGSDYRNSPLLKMPGGRYLLERLMTTRTFASAQPLRVEYPDGRTRSTLDIIAANTDHMAGSLHPRAQLEAADFRLITARRKLGALAVLGGMMLSAPVGETVTSDEQRRFVLTIPHGEDVYLQADGEQHRLTGDRQRLAVRVILELSMAPTGVNMLAPTT